MKTFLPVFFFLLLLSAREISACSCTGELTFCQELSDDSDVYDQPSHVLKAIKLRDTSYGMYIRPLNFYIGIDVDPELMVWGDNGALCRPYTGYFSVGDTLIIALNLIEEDQGNEKAGDYFVSICGVHYLQVENNLVKGPIESDVTEMDLEDFDNYMANQDYLVNCPFTNGLEEVIDQKSITVFPNPVNNHVNILMQSRESDMLIVGITNIHGQRIDWIGSASNLQAKSLYLDVSHWPNGVYFVNLQIDEGRLCKKILVQHD